MTLWIDTLAPAAAIGLGATAVMDLWQLLLKALGIPTMNFALLGRWIGHMPRGQWAHVSIAQATPLPMERALGWAAHYATGVVFAAALVAYQGHAWLQAPTLAPALWFGLGTAVFPLFVMQPAMGAGFASSRTPTPLKNCTKSLANHLAFGCGLYVAALAVSSLAWV